MRKRKQPGEATERGSGRPDQQGLLARGWLEDSERLEGRRRKQTLTIVSGPMDDDWDGAWAGEVLLLTAERIRMNRGCRVEEGHKK